MVCSLLELGISDNKDDPRGIILLEDDAPVGMPLADFMGDIVLEVDVLPNMARCLAMIGVAREVAAITGQNAEAAAHGNAGDGRADRRARSTSASRTRSCRPVMPRRSSRTSRSAPRPAGCSAASCTPGMRPISNIVDITNFVMLEWGQPLHAFDYDVLVKRAGGKAPTIIVRPARAGEILVTLDKQERKLSPEHLVIADTKGPIALAGVMGGLETEVTAATKNILLESASFDFVSIRRTMNHFNLPSEASARFSRGIHPETVKPAAERAADLMRQYAGGSVCKGLVDCYPAPLPPQIIELKIDAGTPIARLGISASRGMCILKALGIRRDPDWPLCAACGRAATSSRRPGWPGGPDRGVGAHSTATTCCPRRCSRISCPGSKRTCRSPSRSAARSADRLRPARSHQLRDDHAREGGPAWRVSKAASMSAF